MKWIALGILAAALALSAFFVFLSVTTRNATAPGRVDGVLTPCPNTPNCVCSEPGEDGEHHIAPLSAGDSTHKSELTMARIASEIRALGGTIDVESSDYLSARFVSGLFRFVDDVEVRAADDGVFHVRSASRAGKSDLKVNRKRIEALRAALNSAG